jgi:hypothetical protein
VHRPCGGPLTAWLRSSVGTSGDNRQVESKYGLALIEARRGADSQAAALTTLRGQATTVITIGGLSATFLGGIARPGDYTVWSALAVVAFLALVSLAVVVSWPLPLYTSQKPSTLMEWADSGASPEHQERKLAEFMEQQYEENAGRLKVRQRLYCAALVALPLELLLLLIDLRDW